MQASPNNNSPQKVKNILIRHSCPKPLLSGRTCPPSEKFYLLRYFPKYYKTLTLEVTKEKSLRSKIKRIKRLKKFTGSFEKEPSSNLWSNLLGNARKDIEELPQITSHNPSHVPDLLYWSKATRWKIKFFFNITKISFPIMKPGPKRIGDFHKMLLVKKSCMRYFCNLRRLRTLERFPHEKLSRMSLLLERLETKRMTIQQWDLNARKFLKNMDLASQLTSVTLFWSLKGFDHSFIIVPQICKNLRFLSCSFTDSVDGKPEFLEFLTSLRSLSHLLGLDFSFPSGAKYYWEYFKPRASLRYLKLRFDGSDLVSSDIIGRKAKDIFEHWEEIEDLDELETIIQTVHILEVAYVRSFFTALLQKVRKLRSLKLTIETFETCNDLIRGEPFVVEEVSHLYDCLEKFEFTFKNLSGGEHPKFDMKTMRVFRNLKQFKFHGIWIDTENIEEMVDLLQTNQKEGDLPMFTFISEYVKSFDWFRETLEKIPQAKKMNKNLKILMDLRFQTDPHSCLELLLEIIRSVGVVKGLFMSLKVGTRSSYMHIRNFMNVIKKYGELRNLIVAIGDGLTYRRLQGGTKEWINIH